MASSKIVPDDLKDPSLFRINEVISFLYSKVSNMDQVVSTTQQKTSTSTGAVQDSGSVTFGQVRIAHE